MTTQEYGVGEGLRGALYVRDPSGRIRAEVPGYQQMGAGVQFSYDGRLLVTPSLDGQVRVWRTRDATQSGRNLRLDGFGLPVGFGAGGRVLATQTVENVFQLWDTEIGQPLGPPFRNSGLALASNPGTGLAMSGRGNWVTIHRRGTEVRIWMIPPAPRDATEIRKKTLVALGLRGSGRGSLAPVPWQEWAKARREVLALRGPEPAVPADLENVTPAQATLPLSRTVIAALIPNRGPRAPATSIDLSPHYNAPLDRGWHRGTETGNDLRALPKGIQQLGGIRWDIRGVVQLGGVGLEEIGARYPPQVTGIRVGRKLKRLHILHASAFVSPAGTPIGSLVFHYADGHKWEVPIVYGRHVRDWWEAAEAGQDGPVVAWTGSNAAAGARPIRLYHSAFPSPLTDVEVEHIDYLSRQANAAPFLIAMTAE
jgi:hypothetical protein